MTSRRILVERAGPWSHEPWGCKVKELRPPRAREDRTMDATAELEWDRAAELEWDRLCAAQQANLARYVYDAQGSVRGRCLGHDYGDHHPLCAGER